MSLGMRAAQKLVLVAVCICVFVPPVVADECLEFVGLLWGISDLSAIAVSGDYAYLGSAGFLLIVDVSDPYAPQPVGGTWVTLADIAHIAVSGDYAYVTYAECVADTVQGGYVVDVSDPTNPIRLGWLGGASGGVAVLGDHAFVPTYHHYCEGPLVLYHETLSVLDVSTPNSPVPVGYSQGPYMGVPTDIAVSGGYAYVSTNGLRVVDVSTPTAPFEAGHADTPGSAQAVAASGDHVFVADGPGGLRVFGVSDPTAPIEEGSLATPDAANCITVEGGYAYVGGEYGLWAVDVSTPSTPIEVGYSWWGATGVAISGGYVYSLATDPLTGTGNLIILRACTMFSDGFESGFTSEWSVTVP